MDHNSLKELAHSETLAEISHIDNGAGIETAVLRAGTVKDGRTSKGVLFVIYQTGRFGPQDGFRVALVHEGVKVGDAKEQLRGNVEEDAAEFVVVRPK